MHRRCSSSVVEHSLGKGEVESSILSCSTIHPDVRTPHTTGHVGCMVYVQSMDQETRVLFNHTCPVCRAEISAYQRRALRDGLPIRFDPLDRADDWGLSTDEAARRLHVWHDGKVLSGLDAFRALWQQMPHLRWLAWLTGFPGVYGLTRRVYDHILAPILYRAHLRRQS